MMKNVGEITLGELNSRCYELTEEQQKNSEVLLYRVNIVRAIRDVPMIVTSGVRSEADQIRIYKRKGYARENIPMGSKHLKGAAVDISDPDGALMKWCEDNEHILKRIGLWVERDTNGWVHFQSLKYGSYNDRKSIFFNA